MRMFMRVKTHSLSSPSAAWRAPAGILLMSFLVACSSTSGGDAEFATRAAELVAQQQAAAELAMQQEAQRAAELAREREEQIRLQAQREEQERREADARARAEQEQQRQRAAAERREQERLVALAAAEAERQQRIDRIAELEQQIASFADTADDDSSAALQQAITVAEELLDVLSAEQAKYEETDAQGNTLEPLQKDLIAELEARKDDLVRRARAQ